MMTIRLAPIGIALDRALAPLDAIAPIADFPSPEQAERAYAIGMLAADLTMHGPSAHLLEICQLLGWDLGDALTIARAISSLLARLAAQADLPRSDAL